MAFFLCWKRGNTHLLVSVSVKILYLQQSSTSRQFDMLSANCSSVPRLTLSANGKLSMTTIQAMTGASRTTTGVWKRKWNICCFLSYGKMILTEVSCLSVFLSVSVFLPGSVTYVRVRVRALVCACVCTSVCVCICICICVCVCVYFGVAVSMFVSTYVCLCLRLCLCL